MRIVKEAEERRNEILDVADELFNQKGFDATSTNDILNKVGIARGTLYYHFKSKEEIMDALIERYNSRLIGGAKEIAANKNIPVNERLLRVVMALNSSDHNGEVVIEHIHKPQNVLMHHKIQKVIINRITPILTEIIQEGIDQGLFTTPFPYESIEMMITYVVTVLDDDMVEMTEAARRSRLQALIYNMGRLLGTEKDSFMFIMQLIGGPNASHDV